MQKEPVEEELILDQNHDGAIFESRDHFKKEISRLCYGDFFIIGRLWIQTLRSILVGADLSLFPVVLAATDEKIPQKPPKMKYKDLPIYECPHYEYKDYMEDKKKCPEADVKILQTYLYPKVKNYRKSWVDSIREFNKDAKELRDDALNFACKKKCAWIRYMRSPDNLLVRQGVLATGLATGYFIGRGGGVLKRLFFTTLGGLATGALCFPKETDEVFREASYIVGKTAVIAFNKICGMNMVMRERIPCRDDMPPPPPVRPADQTNKCFEKKVEIVKKAPEKKPGK